jgi:phenylpyruvate tautomerase PptA (4-oxalocrotonate tautomerase family)
MPLVHIHCIGYSPDKPTKKIISDQLQQALVQTIQIPPESLFHLFHEHQEENIQLASEYRGIKHQTPTLLLEIILNEGRNIDQKSALYAIVAESLSEVSPIKSENIIIHLIETNKANWSFGNGLATYI